MIIIVYLTLNAPWLYGLLRQSFGKALIFMLPNEGALACSYYECLCWESCPGWLLLVTVVLLLGLLLVSLLVSLLCSAISSGLSSRVAATSALATSSSSSSRLYFRRLFLAALSAFFFFIAPTMAERLWSPLMNSSTFCANISRASLRFWLRDRVAWDLTTMPVGMCLSCTAELVLF